MTTALMPLDPSVSPQHANRILPIRANLLPQDISAGRRARRTRAAVIVAVVLVVAMLGAWYWHATVQKRDAEADFASVTEQVSQVQKGQRAYSDLTTTKNTNIKMTGQLGKLMAEDVPWQAVLDLVRTTGATYEVTVTELTGQLARDNTGSTTGDVIGTINISGKAPDKKAVAKYVLALVALKSKGFTDPFVSNVSGVDTEGVTFNLSVSLTKVAMCGTYTTKCS
ncbi:hypothetical protein [Actinoplanes sp. NPDC020271]|uniref:hypothetical protein n=1 Tax=Actinoplanes sp. NPDC020271 TaxID=3363896 RepID=UPI003789675B